MPRVTAFGVHGTSECRADSGLVVINGVVLTDLARYTQAQLDAIARELNTRPRKTLGYRTPAVTLAETVASTG